MVRSANTARDEEPTRQALLLLEKGAKLLSASDARHGEVKREREILQSWLQPSPRENQAPTPNKAPIENAVPAP